MSSGIDATGRVGIGNTNPTNLLMVINARCDGSSWIGASDRNLKQNFAAVAIRSLPMPDDAHAIRWLAMQASGAKTVTPPHKSGPASAKF